MRPIWQPVIQDDTISADGVQQKDLPKGAISSLAITVKALNVTDEPTLENLTALITRLEVVDQLGNPKLFTNGRDLLARSMLDTRSAPILSNLVATDNATRFFTMLLNFGRYAGDPDYCYINRGKGDANIQITCDIATAEADGLILQVSALELAGVSPKGYFQDLTKTVTQSAAQEADIDLLAGVPTIDVLLYGTTVPTTTAWTATWEWLNLIHEAQNIWYQKIYWETIHGLAVRRLHAPQVTEYDATNDLIDNYALLSEGDPDNPEHWIKTMDEDDLHIHASFGDTNAARTIQRTLQTQ